MSVCMDAYRQARRLKSRGRFSISPRKSCARVAGRREWESEDGKGELKAREDQESNDVATVDLEPAARVNPPVASFPNGAIYHGTQVNKVSGHWPIVGRRWANGEMGKCPRPGGADSVQILVCRCADANTGIRKPGINTGTDTEQTQAETDIRNLVDDTDTDADTDNRHRPDTEPQHHKYYPPRLRYFLPFLPLLPRTQPASA
jgi:hypothetical protein